MRGETKVTEVAERARGIAASEIRFMADLARGREDCISFALGEPDFTAPEHVVEAACRAMRDGKTKYAPNAGISELREAIAQKLERERGRRVCPKNEIIVTVGGMEALQLSMLATLNPGDEVIISDPYWTNYPAQIQICGAVPVAVPVYEENGFLYAEEDLKAAIGPKTRMIIVNSPANPTGAVADRENLEMIASLACAHDLFVISDEVYAYFLYDGAKHESIAALPGMEERTILVDSFSKAYAMTGWRVGYAVGPQKVISQMVKLQEAVAASVNTPAQYGALAALRGGTDCVFEMVERYKGRRELMVSGIREGERLGCIWPRGAFYVFANIKKTRLSSKEFALGLLDKTGVVVTPGTGFGKAGEGFVRISYAASERDIMEGTQRMCRFAAALG